MKNILIIQGSARNIESCPNQWGKTRSVIKYAIENFPYVKDVKFEYLDLSVNQKGEKKKPIVQPCKACYSTGGGFHCHWQCSCYAKGQDDLMYENNVYDKLEKCDGFILYTPVNWYSVPSQVKAMFDRLICANLTLTQKQIIKLVGDVDEIKNKEKTTPIAKSGKYNVLLKNHLEGKYAAFFIHGDDGADDYTDRKLPKSFITPEKQDKELSKPISAIMPIVNQCRYSGINVPDDLIDAIVINKGISYYEGNKEYKYNKEFLDMGKNILIKLYNYLKNKND